MPLYTGLLQKWEFQIFSKLKLKLQDATAENLSLARTHGINRDTVGTYFNSIDGQYTSGNFFSTDESGIQIINKPDSLIREKVLKMFRKIDNITIKACCNVASCSNIQTRQQ